MLHNPITCSSNNLTLTLLTASFPLQVYRDKQFLSIMTEKEVLHNLLTESTTLQHFPINHSLSL